MRFTPPPENLVRAEVVEGVRARAAMAADALHLSGVACFRALMHAEYADLVLIEVEAVPDLAPGSDLYQQARSARLSADCATNFYAACEAFFSCA